MADFVLTEEAVADLDSIWLFIFKKAGTKVADQVVTRIFDAIGWLAGNPLAGHRRPDLTARAVLFHRVFSYLIIYAPPPDRLTVLGVIHAKQEISGLLADR